MGGFLWQHQNLLAKAAVVHYLIAMGYNVFYPMDDVCQFNLVAQIEGKLFRITVISTSYTDPHGIFKVALKTSGGNKHKSYTRNFDKDAQDILFAYSSDGRLYNIPSQNITSKTQLSLKAYAKYEVVIPV